MIRLTVLAATTPAEPATGQAPKEGKNSTTKSGKGDPTKTQKRVGDPEGAAKGQSK